MLIKSNRIEKFFNHFLLFLKVCQIKKTRLRRQLSNEPMEQLLEDEDFLLEDEEDNPLDDLLVEAQDAYFENNLPTVIEICDKILVAQPNERETYELLSLALFQSFPPQYERAVDVAQRWAKNCQTNINQLTILMRASYHTNQVKILKDVSRDLASKLGRNQGNFYKIFLIKQTQFFK